MLQAIAILGDISLDVVTYLDASLEERDALHRIVAPIAVWPGGTGVQLALAAADAGIPSVNLLGRVGSAPGRGGSIDLAARFVLDAVMARGIRPVLASPASAPTGRVMITYLRDDTRIMVVDAGANRILTATDLTPTMLEVAASCDCTVVSGYTMFNLEQTAAAQALCKAAADARRLVAVDVVPHAISRQLAPSIFYAMTTSAHLVISEVGTMTRLLWDQSFDGTEDAIRRISEELLVSFPSVLLRPDNHRQILFDRGGVVEDGATGYSRVPGPARRGHLDGEAIRVIARNFDHLRRSLGHA